MSARVVVVPALIAIICLGPFAVAVLAYLGAFDPGELRQIENVERELLVEPIPLPAAALRSPDGRRTPAGWARSRWSLIYGRSTPCAGECGADLARLTEVYLALGRDRSRVNRVFLSPFAAPVTGDPDLVVGVLDPGQDTDLIAALGHERLSLGRIFVVDPRGNLVASYPPDADQRRLLRDLRRLLAVSTIG
jgi:cytochrome oxidase Cu insertion factor (SCO1/SenC/PrrC family)